MALTERKRRYAEARLSGMSKKQAAIYAGCPEKTASQAASRYEKDADVIAAIARAGASKSIREDDAQEVDRSLLSPAAARCPLEFFEMVMNDICAEPKLRLDAAKALASYTVSKPGEAGKKLTRQANAEKSASSGKFAAPSPPKLVVDNK